MADSRLQHGIDHRVGLVVAKSRSQCLRRDPVTGLHTILDETEVQYDATKGVWLGCKYATA